MTFIPSYTLKQIDILIIETTMEGTVSHFVLSAVLSCGKRGLKERSKVVTGCLRENENQEPKQ